MDETSARKGQDYVTTFMDLDARRVLFATEGRDSATVAAFADDLAGHGGDPERISDTSSDMSPAFIAGIGEHLPKAKLTVKQQDTLTWLTRPSMHLATARAHRWREDFQEFYDLDTGQAPGYLRRWCYGAKRSRLQPIKDFVKLVETHWDGIVGWHDSRISNGLLEGTNSLIQAAKARARGYRSKTKMITIF